MNREIFESILSSIKSMVPEHFYVVLKDGDTIDVEMGNYDICDNYVVLDEGENLARTFYVPYKSIKYIYF